MKTRPVFVEEILRETDAAFLFQIDGEEKWVPKSVLEGADTFDLGDEDVEVEVAVWFADKEELP